MSTGVDSCRTTVSAKSGRCTKRLVLGTRFDTRVETARQKDNVSVSDEGHIASQTGIEPILLG